MALVIAIGNTTDYYTNYLFVEHVLKMDTTYPNSGILYRSINEPILFHAIYIVIIVMEIGMGFCCLKGGWLLFRNLRKDAHSFHAAKNWGAEMNFPVVPKLIQGFSYKPSDNQSLSDSARHLFSSGHEENGSKNVQPG